jgi:hypothetical protein
MPTRKDSPRRMIVKVDAKIEFKGCLLTLLSRWMPCCFPLHVLKGSSNLGPQDWNGCPIRNRGLKTHDSANAPFDMRIRKTNCCSR